MADKFQELKAEVEQLGKSYAKYTRENPELERTNAKLREEVTHNNQMVVDAQAAIELVAENTRKLKADADDYVKKAKDEIEHERSSLVAERSKHDAHIASEDAQLSARMVEVVERESKVIEDEKANVAQSEALEVTTKALEAQAQEVHDATKALNNKALDVQKEAETNIVRARELDTREQKIVDAEAVVAENIRQSEAQLKQAKQHNINAQDRLVAVDHRKIEQDKREAFLNNREADIKKREIALNDKQRVYGTHRV